MNRQIPQYGPIIQKTQMTGSVKALILILVIGACVVLGFGLASVARHANGSCTTQPGHSEGYTSDALFGWLTSTLKQKMDANKPTGGVGKARDSGGGKAHDSGAGKAHDSGGGKAHDSGSDAPPKGDAKLKDITEEMISKHNPYRQKNKYEKGSAAKLASDPDLVKKAKDWIQFLHDNKWQGQGEPHPEKIEMSAAHNGNAGSVDPKWCEKYAGTASNCPSNTVPWTAGCSRSFAGSSGGVCANNLTCGRLGQNVAWAGAAGNSETAFNAWAVEGKACPKGNPLKCPGNAGHYTQIVWKHASKMGCAQGKLSNGDDIIVCNYDQGNITTQQAMECNLPTHFVQL